LFLLLFQILPETDREKKGAPFFREDEKAI